MDIRQLRDFVAVADYGTITAAAQALHLSQPPLSTQLKSLEDELGCRLFDRSTRRMQLTEAGRLLYGRAAAILGMCSSVGEELADFRAGGAGTLRLGIVSSVGRPLFLSWLRSFRESHPGVRFEVREGDTYQLLDAVRSRQVELAFVRRPFSAGEVESVPLCSDALCAVGRPEILTAAGESVTPSELAQLPLLVYHRWDSILRDLFRERELHPQILCSADDARTVVQMAREGFGAGIVPRSALEADSGLRVLPLSQPTLKSELCAVRLRDSYFTAAAAQFLKLVCASLR